MMWEEGYSTGDRKCVYGDKLYIEVKTVWRLSFTCLKRSYDDVLLRI